MSPAESPLPFTQFVDIVDKILEECEDDVRCIVQKLGALQPEVRSELLLSDLLNAYQIFYYFFRTEPDALVRERLELEAASALLTGLKIDEVDLLEMIFTVRESKPVIFIFDGEKSIATFSGNQAYRDGKKYLENPEYS